LNPGTTHSLLPGLLRFAGFLVVVALAGIVAAGDMALAAPLLVINSPEHSDIILVLEGDRGDWRYEAAVNLQRQGYADRIVLDADGSIPKYGRLPSEAATEFVNRTTPSHSLVCPVFGESTDLESRDAGDCLARLNVRSVLLVTSDFHTRRALATFRNRLPQYHWSVAAAPDPDFKNASEGISRERAKVAVMEWQKYLWWLAVDQRRRHS
jgi:hypothetical protein